MFSSLSGSGSVFCLTTGVSGSGVGLVVTYPFALSVSEWVAAIALAGCWIGVVVGHVLLHRLLLPLRRMEKQLRQVRRNSRQVLDAAAEGEYLAGLAEAVNAALRHQEEQSAAREARLRQASIEARMARNEARSALELALHATQAKEVFLRNLSHELRTPLTGTLGALTLLAEHPLSPEQRLLAHQAHQSAQALASQIENLLYLSDQPGDGLSRRPEPLDLEKMAKQVLKHFAAIADDKGVQLSLTIDRALPRGLSGNAVHLQHLLILLVDNAIKFTAQGEVEILIGATAMTTAPHNDGYWIRFGVRDTGTGIARNQLEQIFDPFTQTDASFARRHGGAGLGLALAKKIVESQGGWITVESKLGSGSLFVAEVPMTSSQAAGLEQAQAEPDLSRAAAPILVVEDNKINQQIVSMLLRKRGYQVDLAASGGEALDLLNQRNYSLVFMDVQMPGMDGLETTRRIRADQRWTGLPIVAMTAHAMTGDRESCLAAGMNGYISKPFNYEELLVVVRRYIHDGDSSSGPAGKEAGDVSNRDAPIRSKQNNPGFLDPNRTTPAEALQRLFVRMATERIARMSDAAQHHDTLAVSRDSHRLHLASQGMATRETSEITAALERAAHNADWTALLEGLERLREQLKRLSEAETQTPAES